MKHLASSLTVLAVLVLAGCQTTQTSPATTAVNEDDRAVFHHLISQRCRITTNRGYVERTNRKADDGLVIKSIRYGYDGWMRSTFRVSGGLPQASQFNAFYNDRTGAFHCGGSSKELGITYMDPQPAGYVYVAKP